MVVVIKIFNAISESCNSFFAETYVKIINKNSNINDNFDDWSENVKSFGLGNFLNNDLPIGKKGLSPILSFMTIGTQTSDGVLLQHYQIQLAKGKF